MSALQIAQGNGGTATIDDAAVEGLKVSLRGSVLMPNDPGYGESRTVWNAMIDRKPALVARCLGVADVRAAVNFARAHKLLTAVKGGGHNIAGSAVCDRGFQIDLSGMKSVRIDVKAKTAHVEPGATLRDFDHEAQEFGLATPLGINSTTGVAGLTLGAGFGWLSRQHGMTIDNLRAVDIVTANGKFLRANNKENPDLFWAVRGGGGNFGVVTRFEFKLHPLGPDVLTGLVVYDLNEGASLLTQYRDYVKKLANETSVWAVMRQAPPLPFLPASFHGKAMVAFAMFHSGDPEKGKKAFEPVRKFGKVIGEHIGVQPYRMWQQTFDPLLAPGARNYWKSHNFSDIPDGLIDVVIKYMEMLPSPQCEIFFGSIGGATMRVKQSQTAYPHRDANYIMNVHGRWEDAANDEKCISWARAYFNESAPFATGGVYVNFMTDDETGRIGSAYGKHFKKLAAVKKKYDPENLFRVNQNIRPTG
jgi:FAD/FMN-containing dehydrogenase